MMSGAKSENWSGAKQIATITTRGPGKLWCAGDSPGLVYNDLILILNPAKAPTPELQQKK